MTYVPDRWIIVEITHEGRTSHRVFGTWMGGYLNGDSWRMNSGIKAVHKDGERRYRIEGRSGSEYLISKSNYGTSAYTLSVIQKFVNQSTEQTKARVLSEQESLRFLDETAN